MKRFVVYDSQFGNTEKIAQAITKSIPQAKLLRASDARFEDLSDVTLLIVGSPTQGGRATVGIQQFLDIIPVEGLIDVKVAAFDTRIREDDVNLALKVLMKTIGYAASKIAKTLVDKGATLMVPPEGFIVSGKEGPLAPGELARAAAWIKL